MKKEIWRDVVGYEGVYQVSDFGNIRSLDRIDSKRKGRILKQNPDGGGYLIVRLSLNGKVKTRKVHQLVAESFLDHIPCGMRLVVDHINDYKLDNRVENLQIITQRSNARKTQGKYSSNYKGVSFYPNRNKFVASCRYNKKLKYLGGFNTELEASKAYNNFLSTII